MPPDAAGWRGLQRAETLYDLDRHAEALAALQPVLADQPDSVAAQVLLARVLRELGRHEEAQAVARRALSQAPDHLDALVVMAEALMAADRKRDTAEAVAVGRNAVEHHPHAFVAHYTSGRCLLADGRARDALAAANEAVRLAPHSPDAHNLAGMCLNRLMLVDEAVRAYEEAIRLDPQHAYALNNLAALHLDRGKLGRASSLLTSGLSVAPTEAVLRQNHAQLLHRLAARVLTIALLGLVLMIVLGFQHAPWWVRAPTGTLVVAGCAAAWRLTTRRLPRGSASLASIWRRASWWQRALGLVVPGLLGMVVYLAYAPTGPAAEMARALPAAGPLLLTVRLLVIFGVVSFIGSLAKKD